jgi:O-antigen/teichoic acid export membrane protein
MILFPVFSSVDSGARENLASLYFRSLKFLLILIVPLIAVLVLFAGDILQLWLGSRFSEISTVVFQILAAGVLMNSLAQVPFALIQGFGHPDIAAKFHLLELLLYIPLMWLLVMHMGIVGGAIAWTIRVSLDSLLLFVASGKFMNFRTFLDNGLKRGITLVVFLMCTLLSSLLFPMTIVAKAVITSAVLIVFSLTSWRFVLDAKERELIISAYCHIASTIRGVK